MSMTDGAAPAAANEGALSLADAVGLMNSQRPEEREEPATSEELGAAEGSPPDGDDAAAGDDQPPGDDEGHEAAGDDLPPLKAPKSLTQAERALFDSLPRDLQETWTNRERDRDTFYRKGHDEAAAKAKAAEAREQAAEQARLQYEQALPQVLQQFASQFHAEFQDVKTWDDVEAMQRNDPMRFQAWQIARDKGTALQQQAQQAQQRQYQEAANRWVDFVNRETQSFAEKAPEFANPETMAKAQAQARDVLIEVGFGEDELAGMWEQGNPLSLRDHRVMMLVRDAMKYRAAQKAAKTAAKKPVPPVQRPGTASAKGEAHAVDVKILNDKLSRSGRLDDAVALLNARSRKRA